MNIARLFWHDYRYFPYERVLARREVEALLGGDVREEDGALVVPLRMGGLEKIQYLTYFKGVDTATERIVPNQAKLEASASTNGQLWFPEEQPLPSLRRQSTRYSAHGLHEYRGKFNPQVVHAIGNLIGLKAGDWVLDPFCGSGTTLLEAAHVGWNAVGFDVNPLGAMIANAKVAAFKTPPEVLKCEAARLLERLANRGTTEGQDWKDYLPNCDYLARWFTVPVLEDLALILKSIDQCEVGSVRMMFRVVLSDICRAVSLQDPEDLRIRRRKKPYPEFDAITDFSKALWEKVDMICRARGCLTPRDSRQLAIHADSRLPNGEAARFLGENRRSDVDAAITSPPYATALPYVDTQRLSLCLLGQIQAEEIRSTERELIGNREIGDAERITLEEQIFANTARLPDGVARFCAMLLKAADHEDHGFRRRNVPGLVYKYFVQMGETFTAVRNLVRCGGHYALVVGANKTTLRGEEITIDTPTLLLDVATSRGWDVAETISLDTYQRYDLHQKNSIRTETLIILRNARPI